MTELNLAVTNLREATQRLVAECDSIRDDQWSFRPEPSAWSMAHVVEHVAVSNGNLHRVLSKRLLTSPMHGRSPDVIDVEIPFLFYRADEPPNAATPTGTWKDRRIATDAVNTSVAAIEAWAALVETEPRTIGVAHPMFGLMDGVQWLLFGFAHTERHRAQLIWLKRHRNFPA